MLFTSALPVFLLFVCSLLAMHLYTPLVLLLVAQAGQADASLWSRSTDLVTRARHHAVKRSAGLARDLRLSFQGILAVDQPASSGNSKIYCVSSSSGLTSGSGTSGGENAGGASAGFSSVSSATGTAGATAATSTGSTSTNATSLYKLKQSYVSASFVLCLGRAHS